MCVCLGILHTKDSAICLGILLAKIQLCMRLGILLVKNYGLCVWAFFRLCLARNYGRLCVQVATLCEEMMQQVLLGLWISALILLANWPENWHVDSATARLRIQLWLSSRIQLRIQPGIGSLVDLWGLAFFSSRLWGNRAGRRKM